MYPIIEFTGGDRRGKQTQTSLLTHVLQPSVRLEFPDYNHWSGQLIQAILKEEPLLLTREDGRHLSFAEPKNPEIFQLLQSINRVSWKDEMLALQEAGYVVCDRYRNCAEAYGPVDGCDLRWLKNLLECHLIPDLSLVFVGSQLPKPGEKPDINERNQEFQARVMANFRGLAALEPHKYQLIDIDQYRDANPVRSVHKIHRRVVEILSDRLGLILVPLGYDEMVGTAIQHGIRLPSPPLQLTLPLGVNG